MPTRSIIEAPSAFQILLGYRLVEWSADRAIIHLPLGANLANRHGLPHGGVHATLIDTAMGFAGCYTGTPDVRKLAMTLTLDTSFLSRPKGQLLIATGWRTGGGRHTFFAQGEVRDETGELIATGSGAFRYRGAEQVREG